jgi:hypothetical protein
MPPYANLVTRKIGLRKQRGLWTVGNLGVLKESGGNPVTAGPTGNLERPVNSRGVPFN